MRGHGRSDLGSVKDWSLNRWGQDIMEFCNSIGLKQPIIAGFSFGGWVALSYAINFPDHPGKLILCNTEAHIDFEARIEAYRKKGGDTIAEIIKKLTYAPDKQTMSQYIKHCLPLFSKNPYTAAELNRCIKHPEVWNAFNDNEYKTFNFLPELNKIVCPTLVLSGSEDPEHPPSSAEKMVQKLTNCKTEHALIEDAGDPVYRDKPTETLKILKSFINQHS